MDTKREKINFIFCTSDKTPLHLDGDNRRYKAINIPANSKSAKCEGHGCCYKTSCGRFLRPEGVGQAWASYYAFNDVDCDYFEVVIFNDKKIANP